MKGRVAQLVGLPSPIAEYAATSGEYPAEIKVNKAMLAEKHDKRASLRNSRILPTTSARSHPIF
jgi:hypothetical protein